MLWENLREEEFNDAVKKAEGLCIVPIGSIEKHGQHLPLGMDSIAAAEVARLAAEEEYAVVFPTIYIGDMIGARHAGAVSYSPELLLQLLKETCSEIRRNGFDKIVFFNGHGGNMPVLSFFTRAFRHEKNDYTVFYCKLGCDYAAPKVLLEKNYSYLTEEDKEVLQDFVDKNKEYGHACFVETGWTYAIRPETVRLDKIHQEDATSTHLYDEFLEKNITPSNWWSGNYPNSYQADVHDGMNERIARAMVQASIEKLTDQIKFLKDETITREHRKKILEKY